MNVGVVPPPSVWALYWPYGAPLLFVGVGFPLRSPIRKGACISVVVGAVLFLTFCGVASKQSQREVHIPVSDQATLPGLAKFKVS